MEGLVTKAYWKKMKQWLKNYSTPFTTMAAIGSGGNINKVFRLANCKNGRPLTEKKMLKVRRFLEHFTVEERIKELESTRQKLQEAAEHQDSSRRCYWTGLFSLCS